MGAHCHESRHVRHMSRDIGDTCDQPVARDPGHRPGSRRWLRQYRRSGSIRWVERISPVSRATIVTSGVRPGLVRGRRERGSSASSPPSRYRLSSRCRYCRLSPYSAAAAVTDRCLAMTFRTATRCFDMHPTVAHVPTHPSPIRCRLCPEPRHPHLHHLRRDLRWPVGSSGPDFVGEWRKSLVWQSWQQVVRTRRTSSLDLKSGPGPAT